MSCLSGHGRRASTSTWFSSGENPWMSPLAMWLSAAEQWARTSRTDHSVQTVGRSNAASGARRRMGGNASASVMSSRPAVVVGR